MRRIAVALLVVALAACRTHEPVAPAPTAVRGRVENAQPVPKDATVQVYRIDDAGQPTPDPFETVAPDAGGAFATRPLSPGKYRIVYRSSEGAPSMTTAVVPLDAPVVLRAVAPVGLVQVRVRSSGDALRCRLTEKSPHDGVPDFREFTCGSRDTPLLRGVRRGIWTLDLPDLGATTEVEVAGGDDLRELFVDPPPPSPGATLTGVVRRSDGAGAPWLAVTVRPLVREGEAASRWGRYATTDASGGYKIVGIPPGRAFVRVEHRDAYVRLLPGPVVADIPPSGTIHLGFVLEP